jgi:nucleoside-diphosphate-sugar epimerase
MEVLISGINGFLGKSIASNFVDHQVYGLGRSHTDYSLDLSTSTPSFTDNFDLVIHCAGKAHLIPQSEEDNNDFYNVNVNGTSNLLLGLENVSPPKYFVFISSVSVYGLTAGEGINETTPLLAKDPYGESKIIAEELVMNWCHKNKIKCTVLRLPLLLGSNPLGNMKELIRSIKWGYYFNVSGGVARKSMVLASDVSVFINKVYKIGGIYNLTDGYHPNFNEISYCIANQFSKKSLPDLPYFFVNIFALIGDKIGNKFPINSEKLKKITTTLTFDDSKARELIGWDPTPVLIGFKIHE